MDKFNKRSWITHNDQYAAIYMCIVGIKNKFKTEGVLNYLIHGDL